MIFAIVFLHLFLLINTTFTLWPEMTVYPYLLNNDFMIYKDLINPYPPVLSYALTPVGRFFGYGPQVYQLLTWGIILVTDLIIFFLAKSITKNRFLAYLATLSFVIFSIPFGINGLWFDLVQAPLILVSVYFFSKFFESKNKDSKALLVSSLTLAVSFFIKQQAAWLFIFFGIPLFIKSKKNFFKNFSIFLAPAAIIFFMHVIFFGQKNLLVDFLWWVFYFPFFKASKMPGYVSFPNLKQLLVLLSLVVIFVPQLFNKKLRLILVAGFVSLFFAYPRFDFFHLIPSVGLFSLATPQFFKDLKGKPRLILLVPLVFLIVFSIRFYTKNWGSQVRFHEANVLQAASLLRFISPLGDPLYIQNGPDQILPLAGRLPPKPWADEFPWYLELPGMQTRIIEGISKDKPTYMIFKPYDPGEEFEIGSYRPRKLADYLDENYVNRLQISDVLWLKVEKNVR